MKKVRVTRKGRITIPKQVRDDLRLEAGDEIEFLNVGTHYRIRKVIGDSRFAKWRGYLKELEGVDVDELIEEMRGR